MLILLNFQLQSYTLKEYCRKYPNKTAWHKGHLQKGYFLPDFDTYKWGWGIELDFKNIRKFFFKII